MKWMLLGVASMVLPLGVQQCEGTDPGGGGGASTTAQQLGERVSEARMSDVLGEIVDSRSPGTPGWQNAQDLCAQSFADAGYQIELHSYGTGTNVIGRKSGLTRPDEIVMLSAHYDTVPECAGADDNGSGIAGLIAAAEVLAEADYERTLLVACWDEEERGYVGSKAWVDRALSQGLDIKASVVFEMIGYSSNEAGSQRLPAGFELLFAGQAAEVAANDNRGDFITIVTDTSAAPLGTQIEAASEQRGTSAISLEIEDSLIGSSAVGDLRRSDHDPFWQAGYPAIMLTDTAELRNPGYHCYSEEDSLESLDFAFARNVAGAAVVGLADELVIH
jgi:Zn-dependent M28 family amino/carboxypeptidase